MKYKLIAIAGTMGVGKTTLARHLSNKLRLYLLEENFGENPFLKLFYKNPQRWAFHSQLFFLNQKAKALSKAKDFLKNGHVVVDAPIVQYADAYVAANVQQGNISGKEQDLYKSIYSHYRDSCPQENLIIFLSASFDTIVQRIRKRDRDFEEKIDLDYLKLLHELDKKWFSQYRNGLKIETDDLNLVSDGADIEKVVKMIGKRLVVS